MSLPAVPGNVFHAHLTQPSPFSEHIPSDSPFGHGSTPSSTLAQRRATFAGPSFGDTLAAAAAGGDNVGGSAPGSAAGGPLDQVQEEEEDDPMSNTANATPSFAAFSFSGMPSESLVPESSPFEETPTTIPTSRFPPPAASAGKALVSADDLVVPSYALGRRTSVSAESLVPTAALAGASSGLAPITDADTTPTLGSTAAQALPQKSQEQLDRIKQSISNNFLFRNLDEEQERDVLAAMREVHVEPGHVVIEQGAAGDFFYVVEDGQFDIYVKKAGDGDAVTIGQAQDDMQSKWGKKVHTAVPGGSFGELALMYK
jgi:cAMP-dependent protein kinase regulator